MQYKLIDFVRKFPNLYWSQGITGQTRQMRITHQAIIGSGGSFHPNTQIQLCKGGYVRLGNSRYILSLEYEDHKAHIKCKTLEFTDFLTLVTLDKISNIEGTELISVHTIPDWDLPF